jgi:polar amino acid transport system substrate-binding protein
MRKATSKLLVIPVLGIAAVLAGCTSSGASNASAGAAPAASQSHLNKILKSKSIKIAVKSDTVPWGTLKANGGYEGYDVDLANALGKSLGAKVNLVSTTNQTRIPLLQTDKVDAVIADFSIIPTRAQSIEFSRPYFEVSISFDVHKNSSITSYADLDGKTVSVSRGSTQEIALKDQFPNVKAVLFSSYADALQAFKSGKADAVIQNTDIMQKLTKDDSSVRLLDGPPLNPVGLAIGVKQGDQLWLNYVNTFIQDWNDSGQNQKETQKWVGTDMPGFLK